MGTTTDTEINFLKPGITYKHVRSFDHEENTIYEFDNVRYATTNEETRIRKLKGTYLPIVPTPHYFHFLKEYLGSFLYYREHIDPNVKVLWINLHWKGQDYHDTHEPIQKTLELLSEKNIPIVFLSLDSILNNNIEFEKVAVIYDTATFFVSTEFPHFDQFKHTNNEQVREFFKEFMIKDSSYPKKVYVSRRSVSNYLDKHDMKNHISRYNEEHVENALEDFFVQKGYHVINFSGMPIKEQIMYMYNATHVSGLMGANTWNSIFCDNGVKHYCLQTHMWFNHEYNKDIERVIDFHYQLVKIYNVESYESVIKQLSDEIIDA